MKRLRAVVLVVVLGSVSRAGADDFRRGDCNQDFGWNIADPVFLLMYLFQSAPTPGCLDACDCNDDGLVDIADVIFSLQGLKGGGPPPPPPFNTCGADPTADALDCLDYPTCP